MNREAESAYDRREYSSSRLKYEESLKNFDDTQAKNNFLFNIASCWAAEGSLEKALNIISTLEDSSNGDLHYNKALCYFKLSNFLEALDEVEICIEKSTKMYMELVLAEDYNEAENHKRLQQTCLIEAINLKTAILVELDGNWSLAEKCLNKLPVSTQELLDSVSLHNQAICNYEIDIDSSINKLSYLCRLAIDNSQSEIEQVDDVIVFVPNECFVNLLILYSLSGRNEAGLEFLRTFRGHIEKRVPKEVLQFLSIQLEHQTTASDEIVYSKLDRLLNKTIDMVQQDNVRELILSIVTYQGSMLWNGGHYRLLEKLLLKVKLVLGDDEIWKRNLAHVIFMQDTRYDECIQLYENLLETTDSDSLLKVNADILSNLCVAYVLTGRNGDAEALIKNVEAEELEVAVQQQGELTDIHLDDEQIHVESTCQLETSHMCRINLCIGTLYCVKNNHKFGLMRMFKSLEPLKRHLNSENWLHVKRCILALLDGHCKQMTWANDDILNLVGSFLMQCEKHGIQVDARQSDWLTSDSNKQTIDTNTLGQFHGRNSVTYEARYLRSIVLTLVHD
ncbi:hypothetical protein SUGI_1511170 [Cryptomeria japonica]|uniref:Uncharacterized protein n=1 Tax=Cryptomeria japonica TaxID=3369 RepID=A0AAD3NPD2_CRYJA|nr:uncharacterized protein LOC131873225 [Cryptomeria japonica]GLJ59495.1 hypothetical protein SUGI_1511170 [Cryptomeria japonica]